MQRLINVICNDSYIAPHRHSLDPKPEMIIALQGELWWVIFDDFGNVIRLVRFASGNACTAIVIEPTEWHTVVALSEAAALLEVKLGPFDPSVAKEIASWAESESESKPDAYLARLRSLFDQEASHPNVMFGELAITPEHVDRFPRSHNRGSVEPAHNRSCAAPTRSE